MQHIFGGMHICYANLRGKTSQQLFESEIQKMKMLDAAVLCRNGTEVQVLAYCVLDNEFHLVLRAEKETQMDTFLDQLKGKYGEISGTGDRPGEKSVFRKTQIQEIEKEKAVVRCCVRVHMLPVGQGIVAAPEDYWWCSYRDYLGRNWLPLTNTDPLMEQIDAEPKKAVRQIRNLHRRAADKALTIKTKENVRA